MINKIDIIQSLPEATVDHIQHHIPVMQKILSNLIIQIETKYTRYTNSREILNKILNLKTFVLETLLDCKIYLYTWVLRSDNGKAMLIHVFLL